MYIHTKYLPDTVKLADFLSFYNICAYYWKEEKFSALCKVNGVK